MANYNADIKIGVTGKAQLNQLEAQLKRTQTALNKLNKGLNIRAQKLKLDTRAANTAVKQLEDRINRLGRTITVNVRTNERSGSQSSSGGGGGLNAAGLAAAARFSLGGQRNALTASKQINKDLAERELLRGEQTELKKSLMDITNYKK